MAAAVRVVAVVVAAALAVLSLAGTAQAYIYTYDHEPLKLGHLEFRRVGMYNAADAPEVVKPGNGEAFVQVDVTMERQPQNTNKVGLLQVIFAHSSTFPHIGYLDPDGHRHFCCTQDLLDLNVQGCWGMQLGRAVLAPHSNPPVQVLDILWDSPHAPVPVKHTFPVARSGRHYLLFSSCLNSTGDVEMTGKITWMNPYGYLPGELYHFIALYRNLMFGYLALAVVWGVLCVVHRDDLLQLQHFVTVVIVLGLFETTAWYTDYRDFNQTGTRPLGPVIVGVVLSSAKRTLSRLLVLVVCMGFGVMRPSLEPAQRRKVVALGIAYFLFCSVYDVVSSYSQMTHIVQHIRSFFLFPVAALDALFFLWTLQELSANIQRLTDQRQAVKLGVYVRFWQILVTTAVFSVVWAGYQVLVTINSTEDERWDTLWAFEGMWHVIYFGVLLAVSMIWRPSKHAKAYVDLEQLVNVDDDDDEMEMEMEAVGGADDKEEEESEEDDE